MCCAQLRRLGCYSSLTARACCFPAPAAVPGSFSFPIYALPPHPTSPSCLQSIRGLTHVPTRALSAAAQPAVQHPMEGHGRKCQPQVCTTRPDCANFGAKCALFSITALVAGEVAVTAAAVCIACDYRCAPVMHNGPDRISGCTGSIQYSSAAVQQCCSTVVLFLS